jgi:replicative DNA helicase
MTDDAKIAGAVRELLGAGRMFLSRGVAEKGCLGELLEAIEDARGEILSAHEGEQWIHIGAIVHDVVSEIELECSSPGRITGIPTGFAELDRRTAGLQRGDVILLGGRPCTGKTSFALNVAVSAAMSRMQPRHVLIMSPELSRGDIVHRMLCIVGYVDFARLRASLVAPDDWGRLIEAASVLSGTSIFIDDSSRITVEQIEARARSLLHEEGLDLLIIDPIQRVFSVKTGIVRRDRELGDICQALKVLAQDLDVPVLALSRLNRSPERRRDHRPILSDLEGSAALEQVADVVLFIYRDEIYSADTELPGAAEIIIAKQRAGYRGRFLLRFEIAHGKFVEPYSREP